MKIASIQEIKQELSDMPQVKLADLCVRLARFKKENKELLTYLLFEAFDEAAYVENVKKEMEEQFKAINTTSLYFVKKSLRKILRITSRFIRYASSTEVEVKLLMYFCKILKASAIPIEERPALVSIYENQLKKITRAVATLHEDLQYDYLKELRELG